MVWIWWVCCTHVAGGIATWIIITQLAQLGSSWLLTPSLEVFVVLVRGVFLRLDSTSGCICLDLCGGNVFVSRRHLTCNWWRMFKMGTQAIIRVTFRIPVKKSGNCQSPIYRWFSSIICSEPRFERGCSNATVMITRGQGSFWSIPISRTLWVGLESVRRKACVLQRWFFTDASRTTYHTCSQFAFCRWVLQLALNISEYSFGAVTPIVYITLNASGLTPERTSRENVWNW